MTIRRPFSRFIGSVAACLLLSPAVECASAAPAPTPTPLALSDTPLFLATGVKPNLIMAIDDSGSMDFELLLPSNDGAAWWLINNASSGSGKTACSSKGSFVGCGADGTTDFTASNVINFNNAGNAQNGWKKFAYLFPNGYNSASNSDQRRSPEAQDDHFAVPPIAAYAWTRSSDFNPAYFNPSTAYNPWPSGGGFTFANATPNATRFDPVYSTSGKTIDLTTDFAGTTSASTGASCADGSLPDGAANYYFQAYQGMSLPGGTCFKPTRSDGGNVDKRHWQQVKNGTTCTIGTGTCETFIGTVSQTTKWTVPDNTAVAIRYYPATFYLKTSTALPAGFGYTGTVLTGYAPDGSALSGYQIQRGNFSTQTTYNSAIQNFANWFQYYRKRHQALRAGLGGAFIDVTNTRVAGFTINNSSSPSSPDLTMQDFDVASNRTSLYSQFYSSWTGSGGTPNRPALANIVRNFKRTDVKAPIQAACQQNFGMLFTDGFANPPASGDGFDKVGNTDGSFKAPYTDGTSNTMADGIMGAYANALRSDMTKGKVPIPAACGTAGADPSLDCNANLHMNFFAITLGSRGLKFNSDQPVDPYTASPAVVWPTQTQLSQQRNPAAVDDLWHATVNGRGALLNAKSPADISDELSSVLHSIAARVGAGAAVAVNGGSISANSRIFQPQFNSNAWSGDLISYKVNPDGSFDQTGGWKAATAIPAPDARMIFTVSGTGTSMLFDATNIRNDATRLAQIQQTDAAAIVAPRIAYLRGDRTQEQSNGGALRNRTSALGDIIDSAPAYVGAPPFLYRDSVETVPYSSFRLAQANRKQAVYVGANDGMLHAFSADSGQEFFAFVPGGVFNNLYKLTQPTYAHRYYVDSSPVPIDAFYGSAWHTVLTSGLGAGGQSIFALEVTHPDAYTSNSGTSPFMWEFTDATDKDLGYTFSRPLVVRLHTGQWVALFGNGYNNMVADGHASTTGDAVLYIVDVQTGTLIKKIDTNVGMLQDPSKQNRPNGLSSPTVVDIDSDTIVDYVYAGDLYGNLWKFDLTSNSQDSWGVAYSKPIFIAVNANTDPTKRVQPITTKPSVSRGRNGAGLVITFGTGKYLETGDSILSNLVSQTFYGIFDPNTGNASSDVISDRSQLTPQTIVYEGSQQFTAPDGTKSSTNVRAVSNTAVGSSRGWYLDLTSPVNGFEGEMQVTDSVIDSGQVFFTTLIPNSDPCSGGGRSWLMVLNVFSGGRLDTAPFDLNADGNFNSSDYVTLSDGTKVPTSGLGLNDGIGSKPAILSSNDTVTSSDGPGSDLIVINSSNGTPTSLKKNPGPRVVGRQSWRQVR